MKKTISLLLALCILAFAALPAFAATNHITVEPLRYTNIAGVLVKCTESGTDYSCFGKAKISNASKTTMDLYLQTSYDGGVTYKDTYLLASKQFTGNDTFGISGTKRNLSGGCMYRAALYISVYDANGKLIDSAEAYSD